jgi:hypothetical protein
VSRQKTQLRVARDQKRRAFNVAETVLTSGAPWFTLQYKVKFNE